MTKLTCYTCTLVISKRTYRVHREGDVVSLTFCSHTCYDVHEEWQRSAKFFTLFEAYLMAKYGHIK